MHKKLVITLLIGILSCFVFVTPSTAGDKDWARAGKVQAGLNVLRVLTNDKVDPIGTVNNGIRGNSRSKSVYPSTYSKGSNTSWSSGGNSNRSYGHGYEPREEAVPPGPQFEAVTEKVLLEEKKEIDSKGNIVITKIYKEVTVLKEIKR
jgi:hypothetical protein